MHPSQTLGFRTQHPTNTNCAQNSIQAICNSKAKLSIVKMSAYTEILTKNTNIELNCCGLQSWKIWKSFPNFTFQLQIPNNWFQITEFSTSIKIFERYLQKYRRKYNASRHELFLNRNPISNNFILKDKALFWLGF